LPLNPIIYAKSAKTAS